MSHAARAARFASDVERARWHDQALWFVRSRRDRAAAELPEWEVLRERAEQIKLHTLSRLPEYLEELEANGRRGDATTIQQQTHQLIGLSADLSSEIFGQFLRPLGERRSRHVLPSR